jgi:hypothetical protein
MLMILFSQVLVLSKVIKTKNKILFLFTERDPAQVERTNLVNLCKLIVKELIDSSVQYGRMLDSDFVPLQHFFIVLEHALRHGLRPKKVHND